MSSQHQYMSVNNTPSSRVGDIEHINHLSENIGSLCLSSEYSDVTLIVEGQRIPAHKVILAASSDYFRALLYGGMREANQAEVELQAPLQAFKALLRYVYSGHMGLSLLREDTVLDMLGLAHQFNFQELEAAISDYLRQVLALRNVCAVLDAARLYGLEALMDYCYNFLDRNATEVLQHETFLQLSVEALQGLLERDSFFAPEVDIFKAVCEWFSANQTWVKSEGGQSQVEKILKCVRLTLMSLEELLTVVRPFSLVTPDMLLDAIQEKTQTKSTDLPHRGLLLPEENVATVARGARVIAGDMRSALLDGDTDNYDMERGYTRHTISDAPDNPGILVRLATCTILNHLRLLLWDRDNRSYAYYIEVSVDQKDWVRVIDHSNYFCRSWQNLYFEPRVVQYIKIVGTSNTVNKVFHAVSLEAMQTARVPPLRAGLVRPVHNVATVERSAVVIEGISRTRNVLLNGDTEHYDWEQGYTCHQLGSGAIVVQLAQPYLLSSMRMLLWDCDYRHYSYYVETSLNYWDWEVVCDRTRDACRSWQVIYFSPRPVSIIRIVGTNNSVNEVFHLVHLECPAQVEEARDDPAVKKLRPADNKLNPPPAAGTAAAAAASAAGSSQQTTANNESRSVSPPSSEASAATTGGGSGNAASGGGGEPSTSRSRSLPPAETATEADERLEE
ncbi:BTB/POZ domain-containing protein 9 isoform X2 [Galleria mellonella]|uniref:BTB/POZ domain-containing protein 9 isoform X2 n=1 Tax=Galleria mellonella TaxID=7137 RepID=A0ABM3MEE4_GALME|nr:BTB/POZ domain-containing protein 9 isoform X2 [Galleria mellonella]